jgi:hypothetical protein
LKVKLAFTLFYSGELQTDGNGGTVPLSSDGYQSWQIAESIGTNNGQIITIGQTDSYNLLDRKHLQTHSKHQIQ